MWFPFIHECIVIQIQNKSSKEASTKSSNIFTMFKSKEVMGESSKNDDKKAKTLVPDSPLKTTFIGVIEPKNKQATNSRPLVRIVVAIHHYCSRPFSLLFLEFRRNHAQIWSQCKDIRLCCRYDLGINCRKSRCPFLRYSCQIQQFH